MKTAIAIPLKKSRKKKTNVFLRGSCFRYPFSVPFASLEAAPPLPPKVPSVFPPPSPPCGILSPHKAFSMGHSLRSWHPAKAKGCFAPGPFSGINPAIHPMVFPRFSPLLLPIVSHLFPLHRKMLQSCGIFFFHKNHLFLLLPVYPLTEKPKI